MTPEAASVPLISSGSDLNAFLEKCPLGAACALDTEADSLYSYREKLCLLQFGCAGNIALIDPLAVELELSPLWQLLDGAEIVWMHGADYDMSILRRTYGRLPPVIYDTQIAARLLGWRQFGLAQLIKDFFGVELSKQSQKKNWGERPLPAKMLAYAANDVRYILPMAEQLSKRLRELGRWDWFLQSCQWAREQVLTRQDKSRDDLWRVSGWGKLQGRGLAYLRELWFWRDDVAASRDKPPFKVISSEQLLDLAVELAAGRLASLPPRFAGNTRRKFDQAVQRAADLPPEEFPERFRRKRVTRPADGESFFEFLRKNRDRSAQELGIDPSIVASRGVLEKFAFSAADARTPELKKSLFLPWQEALVFREN